MDENKISKTQSVVGNTEEVKKDTLKSVDDLRKENSSENESDKKIETQNKWYKVNNEIENTADSLGSKIDEGIKDSVIALNAFEINTAQSCEGHLDSGMSAPWIRIEAPNEPEERFIDQNETFKKVAEKYSITFEEAKRSHNDDAYWEAMKECSEKGETKDYQKWREESEKLLYTTKEILDDFYKNRQVPDDIKIKVDTKSMEDIAEGSFEIFNGGKDFRDINDINLSEEEKKSLGNRLNEYRKEMDAFANFLKEKFFSEGENYVNDKRNKAQEKIDQEKIDKIMEKMQATESKNYVQENLKDFENVEIKKLSELPYWNKINNFLADKKIADSEIIIIDDEKKWKNIYGSNDSKTSHKPMAIILKKEIFDRGDISEENMSWLIHEIGHIEFYKNLGEKVDEYMEEYHKKGEYTDSEMERDAFRLQFEFLKSIGKTRVECLNFVKEYLGKSFGKGEKDAKKKELEQIEKYINDVLL